MHIRTCVLCGDIKKVADKFAAKKKYCGKCKYLSPERSRKLSAAKTGSGHHHFGKKLSEQTRQKMSVAQKGRVMSLETRKKLSKSSVGKPGTRNGVTLSEETKRKIRIGGIEAYRRKHNTYPNPRVNPDACKLFDVIEKKFEFDGIYATKSGKEHHFVELGYWVDYYEPQKNIVIEYYERQHNRPLRRQRDRDRQCEIEKHTGCTFIVIWEHDTLEEVMKHVSSCVFGARGRLW